MSMKLCCTCRKKPRRSENESKCKECATEYARQWRARNPEKSNATSRRYRATTDKETLRERERARSGARRQKAKAGTVTKEDLWELAAETWGKCYLCGVAVENFCFQPSRIIGFDHKLSFSQVGIENDA